MPKIHVSGEVAVSRDLFSRLISRGLLDEHGSTSEDFLLYIQECLARDSSFVSFVGRAGDVCDLPTATQMPITEILADLDSLKTEKGETTKPRAKSTDTAKIDISVLSSGVSMLYGGSK